MKKRLSLIEKYLKHKISPIPPLKGRCQPKADGGVVKKLKIGLDGNVVFGFDGVVVVVVVAAVGIVEENF